MQTNANTRILAFEEENSRMKFEIEYAQFTKIVIDAENKEEAENIAAVMDGEDIAEHDLHEYDIWNIRQVN